MTRRLSRVKLAAAMDTAPTLAWPAEQLASSPWFSSIRPTLHALGWSRFPSPADWAAITPPLRPTTRSGQTTQFADPAALPDENYEQRIARCGAVATRPDNWHDAFNALCWLAWPQAKAALNGLHLRELAAQAGTQRSRPRDAATLFDESGLVLACADPALKAALFGHDWPALFQTTGPHWGRMLAPYAFGHALLEKGLAPFIGIVAKVIVVDVAPDWFAQSETLRIADLDARLAAMIDAGALADPRALPPLPVLGIPGWWPGQDDAFYSDTRHFRPKRAIHPS